MSRRAVADDRDRASAGRERRAHDTRRGVSHRSDVVADAVAVRCANRRRCVVHRNELPDSDEHGRVAAVAAGAVKVFLPVPMMMPPPPLASPLVFPVSCESVMMTLPPGTVVEPVRLMPPPEVVAVLLVTAVRRSVSVLPVVPKSRAPPAAPEELPVTIISVSVRFSALNAMAPPIPVQLNPMTVKPLRFTSSSVAALLAFR